VIPTKIGQGEKMKRTKRLTKRQLQRIIKEEKAGLLKEGHMQFITPAFSKMPMKSRAIPEFADAIKGHTRINESESYFPISGEPNASWVTFERALWDAAAEMVDAGFPADGVQDAMIRAVEGTIGGFDLDDDYGSGF
jgi:hypothetical protein